MGRLLACACACVLAVLAPSAAFADTITVTKGSGFLYWDGSLTSVTVSAPDSQFITETHAFSDGGFAGGATVNLSTTIPFTNGDNHPLTQTYHGQQYQAWISGSLHIVATPFVAPHPAASADGTFQSFTTPFTATGTITAYATSDRTGPPLFTATLTGRGTMSAGPYHIVGDSYLQRIGDSLSFDSPTSPPCNSWMAADIGQIAPTFEGGAVPCREPMLVGGSGRDIWGSFDDFEFLYQPIAADGDIVAQVVSPARNVVGQSTSDFAKAGVMIRQTVDTGSPHVILDVRPRGDIEFMTRSVSGGSTTFIAGGTISYPAWLKLSRRGGVVTGYVSADGRVWDRIGSTDGPPGDALIGLAVTSHETRDSDYAEFAQVGVWRLPQPWSQTDIGAVGQTGSATATDGVFTVAGAGSDVWGSADAFNAVTQPLSSNATLIARVVDEQNTHMFAKAGLTIGRLAPDAARIILDVRPDGNIEFMARLADGSAMSFIGGASVSLPVWLKLERAGNQFTGSISPDGRAWTEVGSAIVMIPATVPGGLAVTSHDETQLNTSTFDNVAVTATGVSSSPSPSPSQNLLQNPGFDSPTPGPTGWVSDAFRQAPAQFENREPHSGAQDGACRTTSPLDCGLYQEVTAPVDGSYTFSAYANASRPGAWMGVNINGVGAQSVPVEVRGAGAYGTPYSLSFAAKAGDRIRVWLYSPADTGSAVIDDASLTASDPH
jgi:hypothetical protein